MDSNCIFYGRQPREKMGKYYSLTDVCIVSLKKEGIVGHTIPGKLQEYMSAGKSILGFIDGDSRNIITDAACGICVDAEDEIELTKAIESLIREKEKLSSYGKNARKYYDAHFTLSSHVDKLETLLKKTYKTSNM